MTGADIQVKAINAMVAINAAIRNIHLYPISSASAIHSIDKAYQTVLGAHAHEQDLIFAESEKRLIICRRPISDAYLKKPQIMAFLGLLLNLGIKNITIRKGVTRSEFATFLERLSEESRDMTQGAVSRPSFNTRDMPHILVDHKIYVSLGQDEAAGKGTPAVNIQKTFVPMMDTLDFILDDEKKDGVSRSLAASIAGKDEQILVTILTQSQQSSFGTQLVGHIISELSPHRFEKLIRQFKQLYIMSQAGNADNGLPSPDLISRTFQNLLRTEKGEWLQRRVQDKKSRENARKKAERNQIQNALNEILKKSGEPFRDRKITALLPETLSRFFGKKKYEAAEQILERIGEILLSDNARIRLEAAHVMAESILHIPADRKPELLRRLSWSLGQWIRIENVVTPAYGKILGHLRETACGFILEGRLDESNHILEAIYFSAHAKKGGSRQNRDIARDTLREIASDEVMTRIMEEFRSSDPECLRQAIHTLTRMGEQAAETLLSLLRRSEERHERTRIIKVVTEIGPPAIPVMIEHLRQEQPLFYIRELLSLFSRLGDESHVGVVKPFLSHTDSRVRHEGLLAVYNIAPHAREDIFIESLVGADDRMQENIVRMLGRLKSRKSLPLLLKMLEFERNSGKTASKLGEVICTALGYIADPNTIPVLEEILGKRRQKKAPPAVDKALAIPAASSLEMIRKQETQKKRMVQI